VNVIFRLFKFLTLAVLLFAFAGVVKADLTISAGEYVDSSGAPHPWHVNRQHTLIWGGQPWIPAGGLFQSRYLTGPPTDENWLADQADLLSLKQHGIHSIVLVTSAELDPITDIDPADLQKVLDFLDSQGFQYGLALSSFPRDPVEATIVNPAVYRVASPAAGSVNNFSNLSGLTGASYFLVSEADGSILASGAANLIDAQTASVTLAPGQGGVGTVLLLFPKRIFLPDSIEGEHLPDIWAQGDGYRDNLLLYFSKIKFGSGLRFFLDPVVNGVGYYGDADAGAIPDGSAYQFQFQLWLEKRYEKTLTRLNSAWGVKDQDIFDFAAASRCVPLWYQSKGIQKLFDPASNKMFDVNAQDSSYWDDVKQFRADSMRGLMDSLAASIKNGIADVPVVYRWTRPSSLYVDSTTDVGYDGLMVASNLHGKSLASNAAGWALAEAEQSSRSTWLLGELTPSPTAGGSGFNSKDSLTRDTQVLQSLAIKGYFVDSFRKLPEEEWASTSLLNAPSEELDWVGADAASFEGATVMSDFLPNMVYYPINLRLDSADIRQFDDGTWWLPSYKFGDSVDIGPGLSCYALEQPGVGDVLALWSPDGSVTSAQFKLPKKTPIVATNLSGQIVTITTNKGIYTIPTSKTPLLIHGVTTLPLIANATILEMAEAEKLIDAGTGQGIPMDVDSQRLYYIKNQILGSGDPVGEENAYPMLVSLNEDMKRALNPNAWVEGESASEQTFGTVVASPSASAGAFLWQDTASPPASQANPYEATYNLNVGAPGDYSVWASIAPGPPGVGATSPLSYSLDSGTQYDVSEPEASGDAYGSVLDAATATHSGSFTWYKIGSLTLTPGIHSLNFFITGPAPATKRYTLGIDAICLSRGDFTPNGAQKPNVN